MKIIQAAVLVLVGALGAMLYLKVKSGPEAQPAATQVTASVPAQPEDVAANPVAEPVEPAPVRSEKKHTSRTTIAARQKSEPVSKPASSLPTPEVQPAPNPPAQTAPPPEPVPQKAPWTPAQPITLLQSGANYLNVSFDTLVDFGWSTEPHVDTVNRQADEVVPWHDGAVRARPVLERRRRAPAHHHLSDKQHVGAP